MAAEVVGLGQLCLLSEAARISLELTTTARYTSSNHNIDNSSRRLIHAAVTSRTTSRPWIRPTAAFKVIFKLNFSLGSAEEDHGALAATLAELLYHAALWKDLGLRPSTSELSFDHASLCHTIDLQFEYLDLHQHISRQSPHKLVQVSAVRDIRPPTGIEMVDAHCIEFRCQFSEQMGSKRRKQDSHSNSNTSDMLQGQQGQVSTFEHEPSMVDRTLKKVTGAGLASPPSSSNAECRRAKSTLEKATIKNGDHSACHVRTRETSPGITQAPIPKFKRFYTGADLDEATTSTVTASIVQLLDAGIRSAISSEPRRIPKAVQLASHESIRHLNDTLPSLFSPGHAVSMSSRSIMVPTISHVLSHVGGRYASSVTLKTKVRELSRRHASTSEELPDDQSSITTCLWRTMQSSLMDTRAAERLPILHLNSIPAPVSKSSNEQFVHQGDLGHRKALYATKPEACSCCAGEVVAAEGPVNAACSNDVRFESLERGMFGDCAVGMVPEWNLSPVSSFARGRHVEIAEEDLLSLSGSTEEMSTEGVEVPPSGGIARSMALPNHDCRSLDTDGTLCMDLNEVLDI